MPGIGAEGSSFLEEGGWEVSLGFRYQFSDKHFTGTEFEKHRSDDGSEVKNQYFLYDLGLTYGLSDRTSISLSVPFLMADRSQLDRDLDERNETSARGIGDMTITARRWMIDPDDSPGQNVSLGLGLKLPTGESNATDTFIFENDDGEPDQEVRTVDQSIQPGDGGFGFLVDVSAFKQIGRFTPYFSGTYLFNPEETSGVRTYRSRESEAIMSIADQYVARAGVLWSVPQVEGLSLGFGARIEGVPVHDVFGGSEGFRRPGYAVSWDPSLIYTTGPSTFTLSVPWAQQRNRERSVPDMQEEGRHGDAAFADWLLLFGWSYRL